MDTVDTAPVLPVARGSVFDAIVQAGTWDPVVQFATECLQYDWPLTHAEFPSQMRFLWPRHSEFRVNYGVLLDPDF